MGRRGPSPTPTAQLKLLNSREVASRKDEPQRDIAAPAPPSWLGAMARDEWRRVVPQLLHDGVLSKDNRAALTVYCEAWDEFHLAKRRLRKDGYFVPGSLGSLVAHPAIQLLNHASARILRFAQEFGLTPSARARLSVGKPAEESTLSGFVAKKSRDNAS